MHVLLEWEVVPLLGHKCCFRDYYNRYEPGVWKHHAWIVVTRAHAEAIVRRGVQALETYHNATRQAAPDWSLTSEGCSCEAVPLTALVEEFRETHPHEAVGDILGDLERMGVEQKCTTFVSWKNCLLGTKLNRDSIVFWLFIVLQQGLGFIWSLCTGRYDFVASARESNPGNAFPHQFHRVNVEYLEALTQEGFLFARKFYTETLVDTAHGVVPLSKVLPALWDKVDEQLALNRMWSRIDIWGQPGDSQHGTEELQQTALMPWLVVLVILVILTRKSWAKLIWLFWRWRFRKGT